VLVRVVPGFAGLIKPEPVITSVTFAGIRRMTHNCLNEAAGKLDGL
jgi:hypothetical protein